MDDDAILAEVPALLQWETGEQYCGRHHISAGRRHLLKIRLQCRMHVCKRLSAKRFHEV